MIMATIKFGDILISLPSGREAFLVARSYLFRDTPDQDSIILDFKDVKELAPSWGDEFITGLKSLYRNRIEVANIDSPAVKAELEVVLP
jgi:hypothetical protein